MNRKHEMARRRGDLFEAWQPMTLSIASRFGRLLAAIKPTSLAQRVAVLAVLIGAGCPILVAAESPESPGYETRVVDEPIRSPGRPTSGAKTASHGETLGSDSIYDEPAPGTAEWQESGGIGEQDTQDHCDNCMGCGMGNCGLSNFWGRAEAVCFWLRGSEIPSLVTTSPTGTPSASAGILPNAQTLFGDQRINEAARGGGRATVGYWLDQYGVGIEDTFLSLSTSNQSFLISSDGTGSPILARPFFNTATNAQDAFLVAFPGARDGSMSIISTSAIYANELNLRQALFADARLRFDFLVGYRFFHLGEGLDITTNSLALAGGSVPVGTSLAIHETFSTQNQFNGGQVGFKLRQINGPWLFDIVGKLALGAVAQRAQITGTTVTQEPGGPTTSNTGGILALGSNIGTFNQSKFSFLPEMDLNMSYQLTEFWKINFGYTLLFVTSVARPGTQIDPQLDPAQFPPGQPGTSPRFAFHQSNIWLQGLSLGVECSF